jgi:DNA-binding response OmpR family regulator
VSVQDTPITLLVAERDEPLRESVATASAAEGARCAEEARVKVANFSPEVLVLRELGQRHDQLALLRRLREGGDDALPS